MSCSAHGGGMKVNGSTILEGERIVLVPYKREHVPRLVETSRELELVVINCILAVMFCLIIKNLNLDHCNETQNPMNS